MYGEQQHHILDQRDEESTRSLSRDYELWYEDGTIILIAHDVEFRVYRGPLAKHSPLFRDMLSIPQPVEPHLLYQGQGQSPECPLIHLSDSPEDLRHILRSRPYSPARASPNYGSASSHGNLHASIPSFHAISAWIRLGHKYQIDKLVDEGLYHLRRAYPTALPCPKCPNMSAEYNSPIREDRPAGVVGQCAIAVVNLARLTESHDLLPFALLECCKLGGGRSRKASRARMARGSASPRRRRLRYRSPCAITWMSARNGFRGGGASSKEGGLSTVTVDDLMAEGKVEAYRSPNLCSNCLYHAGERIYKERQRFWNALPAIFDVAVPDGWKVEVEEDYPSPWDEEI
ncbi:hypothetical protein BD309DRAFT_1005270 [Dichomitus squalens]|nr:hypothetical protein BD309DRAFT_1005270 [Dichomitus squalens]